MSAPKTCPLCGRKPKMFRSLLGGWTVRCAPKQRRGAEVAHDVTAWSVSQRRAIERWNTRAEAAKGPRTSTGG